MQKKNGDIAAVRPYRFNLEAREDLASSPYG